MQAEVARGQTVNCPNCGTPIASGQRSYKRDYEAYKNASFVAPRKRARSAYVVVASGRSPAAPVRTVWPGPNLNTDVTHVPNLMSAAWLTAGANKIALAYNDLDLSRPGAMEGLLIDCPEAVGKASVVSHFAVVKTKLVAAHKLTDIAEATGEAAAALCILRETRIGTLTLAGFDMEWGMHVHSGPGIDQIWSRNLGGRNQYLIVEAKGPNQATSPNNFMPPDFDQMSIRWIMHNLETMSRNHAGVAASILGDLNVTTGVRWPNYQGAAKSYYGVTGTTGPANADLYGVVVTAKWRADGMLRYSRSGFTHYTTLTH